MALRVLLADENIPIKKALQLALQDYAVDVVTVNAGVDVVPVAMKYKPDVIFADVLLQKKNGYELSTELKSLAETRSIPIVLIWSGFMKFDDKKFRASKADAHLEKPFDTEQIRTLVQRLVPKTQNQKLSKFLDFPRLPDMVEKAEAPTDLPEFTQAGPDPSSWNMEQFAPMETPQVAIDDEFQEVPLKAPPQKKPTVPSPVDTDDSDQAWVSETLTNFRMDKKKLNESDDVKFQVPEDKIDPDTLISNKDVLSSKWSKKSKEKDQDEPPPLTATKTVLEEDLGLELDLGAEHSTHKFSQSSVNERQIEAIVRAQAREMIEKVIWEIVPEIATQVIERELQKLLKENETDNP